MEMIDEFFNRINVPFEKDVEFTSPYGNIILDYIVEGYKFVVSDKVDSIRDICSHNDIIIISAENKFPRANGFESNGFKYKKKCPYPLIGLDLKLFDNPDFPYASDRPKCFYEVKVDGQRCAHEAFFDESLRWKMIKNRIEYSGGYIDAKQILGALNITRTCKQPSWFSKSFAKKILEDYRESDIIVDPFAGWGARHDACKELGLKYIGGDFNKELVDWHQSLNRDIIYKDANEFYYNGECDVLICPPYTDPNTNRCFEDYNFEGFTEAAKAMTQCDWMKVCMRNIPNAKCYILVCKIVDEGWEKFIIDTKKNKSHFGTNNEYILKIPNKDAKELIEE